MILQVGAVYVPPLSRGLLTIVVPSIRPKIKASFLMGVPAPWGPRLTSHDNRAPISPSIYIPRKSKDQTLTVGSRESFTWIIPRTILCLVDWTSRGIRKIGVPPNQPLKNKVFHHKPSILGYHYFRKHPPFFSASTN